MWRRRATQGPARLTVLIGILLASLLVTTSPLTATADELRERFTTVEGSLAGAEYCIRAQREAAVEFDYQIHLIESRQSQSGDTSLNSQLVYLKDQREKIDRQIEICTSQVDQLRIEFENLRLQLQSRESQSITETQSATPVAEKQISEKVEVAPSVTEASVPIAAEAGSPQNNSKELVSTGEGRVDPVPTAVTSGPSSNLVQVDKEIPKVEARVMSSGIRGLVSISRTSSAIPETLLLQEVENRFEIGANKSFKMELRGLKETRSGFVRIRTPEGKIVPIARFRIAEGEALTLPDITFRKQGNFQLLLVSRTSRKTIDMVVT